MEKKILMIAIYSLFAINVYSQEFKKEKDKLKYEKRLVKFKEVDDKKAKNPYGIYASDFSVVDLMVNPKNFSDYTVLPITFSGENAISDNITLAITAGISHSDISENSVSSKITTTSIGLSPRYYFNSILKINPKTAQLFGGVSINYNMVTSSYSTTNSALQNYIPESLNTSDVAFSGIIGTRYFFSDSFGFTGQLIITEGGTGYNLGVSYRPNIRKQVEKWKERKTN